MGKIEATGRTLEEALHAAAQQLGVSVNDLEYEVIEEGSKGFLGIGQTPTSITAWVREGLESASHAESTWTAQASKEPAEEAPEVSAEYEEPETQEEMPGPAADACEAAEDEAEPLDEGADEMDAGLSRDAKEIAEELVGLLENVLAAMRLDAKPKVKSVDDEEIVLDITGKDVAILIGKQGQTLDALQYLIGIAAAKTSSARLRIILDAENYRQRHSEILQKRALEYARAVAESGEEAVLEPQPARDRRIIHLALADHPDVYTYSEGAGEERHVVISPRK